MKNLRRLSKQALLLAAVLAVMSGPLVQATQINKANNTDNLNLTTSWSGGVVPGGNDIAAWDSTVTAANSTFLGVSSNWSGIKIVNPGGLVTINSTSTNNFAPAALTFGASGIDLSGASQNLTINAPVTVGPNALENWGVATGRTLTLAFLPTKVSQPNTGNSGGVRFSTTGTIVLSNLTANILQDNLAQNPYATYGDSDWAGVSAGTVVATTYTAATTIFTANVVNDVQGSFNVGTIDVTAERFNDATPRILAVTGSGTHTARGILVTPNSGGGGIFGTGFMRPARSSVAGTMFPIYQNSSADFSIGCILGLGSSSTPVDVVKFGPGNLILTNPANAYGGATGGLTINGGTVTINSNANVSGFTRVNNGTFSVYNGSVVVQPSYLWFADGTTNKINVSSANGQFVAAVNYTNAGALWLQFNYASGVPFSTTTAPFFASSNLAVLGAVNVAVISGNASVGQFPLIKWTSPFSGGTFANFNLAVLPLRTLGYLSNNVANNSIDLVVTNVNEPIKWATGNGTWDIFGAANWLDAVGASTTYQEANGLGDNVLFDDSATGTSHIVTLNTNPVPGNVTVNGTDDYTISGSGSIRGVTGLVKSGSGTLTLGTTNSFMGPISLNGGVVNFNTLSNLGVGAINFGGGTLKYNGNTDDISVRTITLNAGGATIDLNGNAVTFTNPIGNGGAGGLTLTGGNKLLINQNNRYAGNTVINSGSTLSFLNANTFVSNSAALIVNGTLDAKTNVNLTLSSPVSQILAGTGTVQGEIFTASGTTISPATNGTVGTLAINGDLTVNGGALPMDIVGPTGTSKDLLAINSSGFGSGNLTLGSGANAGALQLNVSGTLANGTYTLITYSGTLSGGPGNLNLTGFSQAGQLAYLSSSAAVNGAINLKVISGNTNSVVWAGGNNANAWDVGTTANWIVNGVPAGFYANGNSVTFDDTGDASSAVSLKDTFVPGSMIINVTNKNYTFADGSGSGVGLITGNGRFVINSASTNVTTVLVANNYTGPTAINGGILQVGNGSATGDIGSGNVTNNGTLIFQQTDNRLVAGAISGTGSLIQEGLTTLSLGGNNSYAGQTIISNTTSALQIGTGGASGTLGNGAVTDNGTLIFNRSGSVAVGNNISGPGNLVKLGSSTLTFSGSLTYQGNTYISNGVVKLTANNQIPDTNSVSGSTGWLILDGGGSAGGTFDLGGFNETINALSGLAGTVNGLITNSGTTGTNVLTVLGSAATTYNGMIADNNSGAKIQLVLVGTNTLRFNNNANTWSGGTIVGNGATLAVGEVGIAGTGGITMSNGATINMPTALSTAASIGNTITTLPNSSATFLSGELANNFGGSFVGNVTATNVIASSMSFGAGAVQQYSNFLGTVLIPSGGTLRFSSTSLSLNGGDNTVFDIEGTGVLQTRNQGTVRIGALQGNGFINNPQANTGTGVWQIGANNSDSVFSGYIQGTNSIVKIGTGRLTLNGGGGFTNIWTPDGGFNYYTNIVTTNGLISYAGATTISNGVLALVVPVVLTNWPTPITLASATAVLDASQMGYISNQYDSDAITITNQLLVTNGVLEIVSGQVLEGVGEIRGTVLADVGSILNPGNTAGAVTNGTGTGVLNVTNHVTIAGDVYMRLNRTNPVIADELTAASFTISPTATLTVTNMGQSVQGGEVFQLFNHPVSGFASIVLPNVSPFTLTDKLAINGTLVVSVSTDADLTNLVITPAGTLSPVFVSNTLSYATTEAYANSTITVTPTDMYTTSTNRVIYNGVTNIVASGTASGALALDPSPAVTNVVKIEVTAQDGVTVKTYVVNVVRLASLSPRPQITNSFDGTSLTLTWPVANTTFRLFAQTNTLAKGLGTNWVEVQGASATNKVIMTVNPTNGTVFFRLVYP